MAVGSMEYEAKYDAQATATRNNYRFCLHSGVLYSDLDLSLT